MSLVRFGSVPTDQHPNGSQVYVFRSIPDHPDFPDGHIECCACLLGGRKHWRTTDPGALVAHLREHEAAGHYVPAYVFEACADGSWVSL